MATNYNYTENGRVYPFDDVFVRKGIFYSSGEIFGWGDGANGALATNDTTDRNTPVQEFTSSTIWKQVSAGETFTTAIKTDGTLWTWGENDRGQLGINDNTNRLTPVQEFTSSTNWRYVDCGLRHVGAIKTDGTLWMWGDNSQYGLGVNDNINRSTPVQEFTSSTNWKQVACSTGNNHSTYAIQTNGTLWYWGFSNSHAIVSPPTQVTPVQIGSDTTWNQVDIGSRTIAAVKTDGTIWVWGFNDDGDLGLNDDTRRFTPVQLGVDTTWKQVSCSITSILSSNGFVAAVKTDGTLWTWGHNPNGQLGVNDTSNRSTPVQEFNSSTNWRQVSTGQNYSTAIKTDGTIWTWGLNDRGIIGANDTNIDRFTPVQEFTSSTNWIQVAAGRFHISAMKASDYPILY